MRQNNEIQNLKKFIDTQKFNPSNFLLEQNRKEKNDKFPKIKKAKL